MRAYEHAKGSRDIWFWQRTISPHMAVLAVALAARGHRVAYNVEQEMCDSRKKQGWVVPQTPGVEIRFMATDDEATDLVRRAPRDSIHVCQGIRGNGRVRHAQRQLAIRGMRYWVTMEMVDDSGLKGAARGVVYRGVFAQSLPRLHGVLAIGGRAESWIVECGVPPAVVFPFAYFLTGDSSDVVPAPRADDKFRFLFVGRLIPGKRLNLLIEAMSAMPTGVALTVIGDGPERCNLERQAASLIRSGISVEFLGVQPTPEVRAWMASSDCLVLPSRYDGWGAVVSEALMSGTPVVCSDSCGAAVAVQRSGYGGVFRSGNVAQLSQLIRGMVDRGSISGAERRALLDWSQCLSAEAGAAYLEQIIVHSGSGLPRPVPPWELMLDA